GWVMQHLLHGNRLLAVVIGGVSLIIAAGLTLLLHNTEDLASEIQEIEPDTSLTATTVDEQQLS
ncbi:MAG: hypothetical protein AAFR63_15865, partial [Cyanobacteria bacterium J06631_6]